MRRGFQRSYIIRTKYEEYGRAIHEFNIKVDWPNLYRPDQGPELTAEELLLLEQGADYGWPECYFDGAQQKLVLAPE